MQPPMPFRLMNVFIKRDINYSPVDMKKGITEEHLNTKYLVHKVLSLKNA